METFTLLTFTLGGRGGARASVKLNFPAGKDTLLRSVRRMNQKLETEQPVKILGVDDFAFRKGVSYGTILVDLVRRQPIDLLPDRTAATLAAWLKAHPEIEIVSRDRSTVYVEAARQGAPHAEQVADRWHLLKNLGDLVERYFIQNHRLLTETAKQIRLDQREKEFKISLPSLKEVNQAAANAKPIPARRQKLFDAIKDLQSQGKSMRGIARELKIARNTVSRYIFCETAPPHTLGAGRPSSVLPFAEYLEKRWRTGEHNGYRLWQEIKAMGFRGASDAVHRFVRAWRGTAVGKTPYPISVRGLAPRKVAKLLLNPASAMNKADRNYLKKLLEIAPAARTIQQLGIKFQQIIKEQKADSFDDWLAEVKQSDIKELANWANGLLADESAVRNALSLPWSNGQVEGQVNRLKTIKRQMYGRANFDLLKARVLYQV